MVLDNVLDILDKLNNQEQANWYYQTKEVPSEKEETKIYHLIIQEKYIYFYL